MTTPERIRSDRLRADRLLVERGLFDSRAKAQAAIEAGLVLGERRRACARPRKTSRAMPSSKASPAHPYVSRGGVKLAAALDAFGIDPQGRVCLDVGASTGGFTEVLLDARRAPRLCGRCRPRAAARSLRGRPEVVSLEETDIRTLPAAAFDDAPNLIAIDVSFISLKLVLPAALALAAQAARSWWR